MIDLFDFQREDCDKLDVNVESCLIANEMGTGKTWEAIERDCRIREKSGITGHTLVIAPLTVLPSWKWHFETLTGLTVVMIDPKNRGALLRTPAHVYLVHWEALRLKDMIQLTQIKWLHKIMDECHRAKNRKAQQTAALKKIKAYFKTALSGTPVVNAPHELWSILNELYPDIFRSYWSFYKRYVNYEILYPQGYHQVTGPKNVEELHTKLEPFYVRRLKVDVLKDLPEKYYTDYWVELTPSQRRAYDQMKKELIAWVGENQDKPLVAPVVIAQLIRLQQFAVASADIDQEGKVHLADPSSKIDLLIQILEDNPDEQLVVFSQFKQLIRLVEARLQKAGISHVLLTGDTRQLDRGDVVQRFQDGGARVFAGTIQAGGIGITLHAASTVVFLDRSWSPATNLQAEDRLHRIGQRNAVQVIDIMATNTVDLGRRARLEQKWSWIRQLLGDE